MIEPGKQTERRRNYWSAANERVIIQAIHWGVVVIAILAITFLAATNHLDKATTGSLFGIVLGHTGTAAATKLSSRRTDG